MYPRLTPRQSQSPDHRAGSGGGGVLLHQTGQPTGFSCEVQIENCPAVSYLSTPDGLHCDSLPFRSQRSARSDKLDPP